MEPLSLGELARSVNCLDQITIPLYYRAAVLSIRLYDRRYDILVNVNFIMPCVIQILDSKNYFKSTLKIKIRFN